MNKPDLDKTCQAIMEHLLQHGYQYQVSEVQIEAAIFFVRGMDQRTCQRWIKVMETLEYIKVSNTTPSIRANRWLGTKAQKGKVIYEMNVTKIPQLFQVLRNHPQTRIG